MRITWHGHAFFEVEARNGKRVLIDPFIDGNPLCKVRGKDLRPDIVVVTHGHGDHFGNALDFKVPVLGIYEIQQHCLHRGNADAIGLNIGGSTTVEGVKFTLTSAAHSAGMPASGPYLGMGGNPCGVILDDGQHRLYHAGDTGLFGDMKHVIGAVHEPDIALLPIGGHFTMDPELAAIATEWLGVRDVVPMHYNTFSPIKQDPKRFERLVAERCRAKVHVMEPGESVAI